MEKESRVQLGCALATCLGMALMLCGAVLVLGRGLTLSPLAASQPSPSTPPVDRLALIGADGNVYVVDRRGGSQVAVTSDASVTSDRQPHRLYAFPNWSPDGKRIAFVGLTSAGTAQLFAASALEGKPREIYASADAFPLYLSWAPDSRGIAFLTQNDNDELALNYVNADGGDSAKLGTGSPFYFSWSPDSRAVISHVGGNRRLSADAFVGLHTLEGRGEPLSLTLEPGDFLAPSFSPDGREVLTALMGKTEANNALIASDRAGQNRRTLATYSGAVAFNWSPDGKQIAYMVSPRGRLGANTQIHLVRADGDGDRVIADDSPLAFFWSPDGKQIAYLAVARGTQGTLRFTRAGAQQQRVRLAWKLIRIADGAINILASFVPTDAFASLIPYFDQYAQSLRVWSPDSTSLVYAAVDRDDAESIYVAEIGNPEPRRIAGGSLATWSWK